MSDHDSFSSRLPAFFYQKKSGELSPRMSTAFDFDNVYRDDLETKFSTDSPTQRSSKDEISSATMNSSKHSSSRKLKIRNLSIIASYALQKAFNKNASYDGIIEALKESNLAALSVILSDSSFDVKVLSERSPDGDMTPLMIACQHKAVECVQALLRHGADVNDANERGMTALMYATCCNTFNSRDNVLLLINYRADVNLQCASGCTALMYASFKSHLPSVDNVRLLLANGARVDTVDKNSRTAIMYGCWHVDVLRELVSAGADVNVKDKNGRTAATYCSFEGANSCISLLRERGANLDSADELGRTPLHCASLKGLVKTVKTLTSLGVAVDHQDAQGRTALMCASREEFLDCVAALVEAGAAVNSTDESGKSALIHACTSGAIAIVRLLIENNADASVADIDGTTALMVLVSSHYLPQKRAHECMRLLLDKNANVNAVNLKGQTALMMACERGVSKVVTLLLEQKADPQLADAEGKCASDYCKSEALKSILLKIR